MRLKHRYEVLELGDQVVAVPVGESSSDVKGVLKMNETAAFIFNLLKEDTTEEAILDALKSEYDAPEELLRKDICKYIQVFKSRDMLLY